MDKMLQIIKSYFHFLWKSTNEHGIHSPFVFDLVTKCFQDKNKYIEYQIITDYRNSLIENKNYIEVTDFGAGSRVFKSNKRQIAQIAKTAGISRKRVELLFRMVQYFQPENVLEIGTSLGLATVALSLGNKNSKITTLEGCAETIKIADYRLQKTDVKNIKLINTEFLTFFKSSDFRLSTFDLIYFDGNHSKTATLEYFEQLLPTITNDSVWVFDDIHWSKDMEIAWEMIKKHPKVKVTIDTFQWGIVFFRAEQEKEHFVVRV